MRAFFLALFFGSAPLYAHPHVWIDVEITPKTSATGELIAISERWEFDPLYAQMLLESVEAATSPSIKQALWAHLQQDLLHQLAAEQFYTTANHAFLPAREVKLSNENQQLSLQFTLPLAAPARELDYQIYESQYFVEVLHSQAQTTAFANGCTLKVYPANPTPERYEQAAALDRNEKSPEPLGQYFAERGKIQCQ